MKALLRVDGDGSPLPCGWTNRPQGPEKLGSPLTQRAGTPRSRLSNPGGGRVQYADKGRGEARICRCVPPGGSAPGVRNDRFDSVSALATAWHEARRRHSTRLPTEGWSIGSSPTCSAVAEAQAGKGGGGRLPGTCRKLPDQPQAGSSPGTCRHTCHAGQSGSPAESVQITVVPWMATVRCSGCCAATRISGSPSIE